MAERTEKTVSLGSFLLELAVYSIFVFGYFFLVLHFLGGWLKHLFDSNKVLYAFIALALIVVQGVVLEMLTTGLLKLIHAKRD